MTQDSAASGTKKGTIDLPPLLSRKQLAAGVLGVSERSTYQVTTEDWFPSPIQLGERILRWRLEEVLAALACRAPRRAACSEPQQLAAARSVSKAGVPV
jgi:predicted DNA-binding transcriptional regulator AlpA